MNRNFRTKNYLDLAEYTKIMIDGLKQYGYSKLKKETVLNELKHFPITQKH